MAVSVNTTQNNTGKQTPVLFKKNVLFDLKWYLLRNHVEVPPKGPSRTSKLSVFRKNDDFSHFKNTKNCRNMNLASSRLLAFCLVIHVVTTHAAVRNRALFHKRLSVELDFAVCRFSFVLFFSLDVYACQRQTQLFVSQGNIPREFFLYKEIALLHH